LPTRSGLTRWRCSLVITASPSMWRRRSLPSTLPFPRAPPFPSRSGTRARSAARPAARPRRPRAPSTIPPSTSRPPSSSPASSRSAESFALRTPSAEAVSGNRDHDASRRYHEATRHSRESVRASGHGLDWSSKPEPFKIYPDLPVTPLPRDFPVPTMDALAAISGKVDAAAPLDLARLAALLFFSAGVTRRQMYPGGGVMYFRAAPSTGALFQTEVYVVAGGGTGLGGGGYSFWAGGVAVRAARARGFCEGAALSARCAWWCCWTVRRTCA